MPKEKIEKRKMWLLLQELKKAMGKHRDKDPLKNLSFQFKPEELSDGTTTLSVAAHEKYLRYLKLQGILINANPHKVTHYDVNRNVVESTGLGLNEETFVRQYITPDFYYLRENPKKFDEYYKRIKKECSA